MIRWTQLTMLDSGITGGRAVNPDTGRTRPDPKPVTPSAKSAPAPPETKTTTEDKLVLNSQSASEMNEVKASYRASLGSGHRQAKRMLDNILGNLKSDEIRLLQKLLPPKEIIFLTHGNEALVFKIPGNKVARLSFIGPVHRPESPVVLQPIEVHQVGAHVLEILPKVKILGRDIPLNTEAKEVLGDNFSSGLTVEDVLGEFKRRLGEDYGLAWEDYKIWNMGIAPEGRIVVVDPHAVVENRTLKPTHRYLRYLRKGTRTFTRFWNDQSSGSP